MSVEGRHGRWGTNRDARAIAPLISALASPDKADVVMRVYMGPPLSSPTGDLDGLEDLSPGQAAIALARIQDTSAVPLLITLLKHKDAYVRWAAAWVLEQLHDVRAVEPLIEALQDANANVVIAAARALAATHVSRAIEPIIALLPGRCLTFHALTWPILCKMQSTDQLIANLQGRDHLVSSATVRRLGEMKEARAVDPLIALLSDASSYAAAAEALGKIGDTRAVEPLIATVKTPPNDHDDDPFIRRTFWCDNRVIEALGKFKDTRAQEVLFAVVNDKSMSSMTRVAAMKALAANGDRRMIDPLIAILREEPSGAVEGLRNFKDPRTVEPLIAMVENSTYDTCGGVIIALGETGDERAIEPLIRILEDEADEPPQGLDYYYFTQTDSPAAVSALGHFKSARVTAAITDRLMDLNWYRREAAEEALGLRPPVEPTTALYYDPYE